MKKIHKFFQVRQNFDTIYVYISYFLDVYTYMIYIYVRNIYDIHILYANVYIYIHICYIDNI